MPLDVSARVLSNTKLSDDYNVVELDARAIAERVRPGQFVMLQTTAGLDPLLRRPFSVFEVLRAPDGSARGITLLNKRIGRGTRLVYDLRPAERVACLGPLGRPFTLAEPPGSAWIVAGGVGLAAFATLVEALRGRGTETTLFYGGRRATDLHCVDLFERLGAMVRLSTEDGSRGAPGLVTAMLTDAFAGRASPGVTVYACGPTRMMRAVQEIAAAHHSRTQVSLEPVMGCGLGGCYSCVVRVTSSTGHGQLVRSCLEGPVFWSDDLVWDALG